MGKQRGRNAIVGKYFHSWKNGEVVWQGRVREACGTTHLLVVLFDWFYGDPNCEKLVPLNETASWTFYETAKDMRHAWWEYEQARDPRNETFEESEAFHDRLAALMG